MGFTITNADSAVCKVNFNSIKYGKSNSEVLIFQNFLITEKAMGGKATNYFGPATKAGIVKYQKNNGLKQTGLVDAATITFIKTKNCSQTTTTASSTTPVTNTVNTATTSLESPFKLELSVDKYKINPEDQVIFTVKLTNVSNATITDYRIGRVDCRSDNLKLEAELLFDNSYNFWPVAMFTNPDICANTSYTNYAKPIPPNKTFDYKVAYKNFSKATTQELMNYGSVTDGEHQGFAQLEIYVSNKTVKLKSNTVKFYTVVDKSPEFPTVSISLKTDKSKIKKGEYIKVDAVVKNVGKIPGKDDYVISYGMPGNISERRQFYIDGIYDVGSFFQSNGRSVGIFIDHDTLFKNYTGTFKVNEEKYYSFSVGFQETLPKDDLAFIKKVKGQHTIQFIVDYQDNFGKTKRYESPKVPFEVVLD